MSTRTLNEISAKYGPAKPTIRDALLATSSPDRFGAQGAQIGTDKPLGDLRLLLGTATEFWDGASAEQLTHLTGVGPGFFAVAAAEGLLLEDLWIRRNAHRSGDRGDRADGTATRDEVQDQAIVERGKAVAALRGLAGRDSQRLRAIDEATGTAVTDEDLAIGLEACAALGVTWAAEPELADLAADGRIDRAWASRLAGVAATLRAAALEGTRRTTAPVTQAELDHQDGIVLHLLDVLIDVFEAGHRADRRIPRLTPRATYKFFRRTSASGEDQLVVELTPDDAELPPEV